MALTRIKTDSITANAITTEKISSSVNFGLRNKIINGDMKIAQRNTTGSLGNSLAYVSLDRWGGYNSVTSANITLSQVAFTPGQTDVPGATHYLSLQDVGAPLSATRYVAHRIEDVTTLAGQTATLSFYLKTTGGTGTPYITTTLFQNFGSGGSTTVTVTSNEGDILFTDASTWTKITRTFIIPSIADKTIGTSSYLELRIRTYTFNTFQMDIAQVQLEVGNVATPFEERPYGLELALCQRYYEELVYPSAADGYICNGGSWASTQGEGILRFAVPKRTTPTMNYSDTIRIREMGQSVITGLTPVFDTPSIYSVLLYNSSVSGLTTGRVIRILAGSTSTKINASAEL